MHCFLILISVCLLFNKYADSKKGILSKKKDKDRFWMFDEFWESSFDIPWNPRNLKDQDELTIDRNKFTLWSGNYKDWSLWSDCDPIKCVVTRHRECKDDSWRKVVRNIDLEMKCTVRYIYEARPCKDNDKCLMDSSNNFAIDKLPRRCGTGPKMSDINQIVEGNAVLGDWPWNAGLYIKGKYEALVYTCGATLINHGWAITASECLRNFDKLSDILSANPIDTRILGIYKDLELVVNDRDRVVIDGNERKQKISHIVFHPDFQKDVALLKIDAAENIDVNKYFPCLSNNVADSLSQCYVVGWNKNKFQIPFYFWRLEFSWEQDQFKPGVQKYKHKNPSILQQVKVSISDFEKCKKNYPFYNLNSTSHICASTRSKKSCRGDSGGGLFCYNSQSKGWHLQGITNFVEYQGCEREYEFYVNTGSILDWINNTIKKPLSVLKSN